MRVPSVNDQVEQYLGLVEGAAKEIANSKAARKVGAEYEDLRQEGMLAVWQAVGKGVTPSGQILRWRMKAWIRLLARQKGYHLPEADQLQHIPYDQMLPLDDFRAQPGES